MRCDVYADWDLLEKCAVALVPAARVIVECGGYEEIKMNVPIGLDRPFVITRAWEEANGKITPHP